MSMNGLKSAVLEAGGHIEERCQIKNLPNFTEQYVFTREALEKLLINERERCARECEIVGMKYQTFRFDLEWQTKECAAAIRALGHI